MDRYILLFKKLCIEQRRTLLIGIGGYLGFWVIIGMLSGYFSSSPYEGGSWIIYCLLGSLMLTYSASYMFHEMSKRKGRISVLMTPATSGEKFIVRLAIVLPGMFLVTVLGYFLYGFADSLTFAITKGIWIPFFNPFKVFDIEAFVWMTELSVFLFMDALFIFGSVAWPKRSYPKTLLLIAGLFILFFLMCWMVWKIFSTFGVYARVTDEYAFYWSVIAWILLFAVAIVYGAFLMFKRKTIS